MPTQTRNPGKKIAHARLYAAAMILALSCGGSAARPAAAFRKPNLTGKVMVLEYHHLGGTPLELKKDTQWRRSFASFDHDLAQLEAGGYRPITLRQLTSGKFRVPAGTTPVVLTFDDSLLHQVKFTPRGKLDADCVLAHWLAFSRRHPDFPMRGVFFVNSAYHLAFRQPQFTRQKLELILKLGGEVGNHTWEHTNLGRNHDPGADIGRGQQALQRWLPNYSIVSFALPYGVFPHPNALAWAGSWRDPRGHIVHWNYRGVVLVGAGPAPSPYTGKFDAHRLPRIQVFDHQLSRWLRYFDQHPGRRFISDGKRHPLRFLSAR